MRPRIDVCQGVQGRLDAGGVRRGPGVGDRRRQVGSQHVGAGADLQSERGVNGAGERIEKGRTVEGEGLEAVAVESEGLARGHADRRGGGAGVGLGGIAVHLEGGGEAVVDQGADAPGGSLAGGGSQFTGIRGGDNERLGGVVERRAVELDGCRRRQARRRRGLSQRRSRWSGAPRRSGPPRTAAVAARWSVIAVRLLTATMQWRPVGTCRSR